MKNKNIYSAILLTILVFGLLFLMYFYTKNDNDFNNTIIPSILDDNSISEKFIDDNPNLIMYDGHYIDDGLGNEGL